MNDDDDLPSVLESPDRRRSVTRSAVTSGTRHAPCESLLSIASFHQREGVHPSDICHPPPHSQTHLTAAVGLRRFEGDVRTSATPEGPSPVSVTSVQRRVTRMAWLATFVLIFCMFQSRWPDHSAPVSPAELSGPNKKSDLQWAHKNTFNTCK